jgi:hypothetical protein
MILKGLVRQLIQAAGIKGVSVGGVVLIVAVYAYTSKAATAGGAVVSTASRTGDHLRAALVLVLVLVLLGVISVDMTQATELVGRAWRMIRAGGWLPW